MAATAAGRRLTDAHRTAQARISASTTARLLQVWPLLEVANLDTTTARWLAAAVPIIQQSRSASRLLAGTYIEQLRAIETPPLTPAFRLPAPPVDPLAQIRTSLIVTGPVAIKSAVAVGRSTVIASRTAALSSAVAGSRHALAGGRELVMATIHGDPMASGMVRVVSPGACAFCVEIAGFSETNADLTSHFQCHDNCHCQPEPVFG